MHFVPSRLACAALTLLLAGTAGCGGAPAGPQGDAKKGAAPATPSQAKADPANADPAKADSTKPPEGAPARPTPPATTVATAGPDPAMTLRPTTALAVHIDLVKLSATPAYKSLSTEGMATLTGADPDRLQILKELEGVTMHLNKPEPGVFVPISSCMVFKTKAARDAELDRLAGGESATAKVTKVERGGQTYVRSAAEFLQLVTCYLPVGDRGLYVGSEPGVQEIIDAQGKVLNEGLAKYLKSVAGRGQVTAAVDIEPVRQQLLEGAKEAAGPLPQLAELPNWTKGATAVLDLEGANLLDLEIDATSDDTAGQWLGFTGALAGMGSGFLTGSKEQIDALPAENPAKKLAPMAESLLKFKAEQSGSRVVVKFARPAGFEEFPKLLASLVAMNRAESGPRAVPTKRERPQEDLKKSD